MARYPFTAEANKFIREIAPTAPFRVGAADNIGYFTDDEPYIRGISGSAFPGCAAGLSVIGIDSVGNVRGCESMYDERFIEGVQIIMEAYQPTTTKQYIRAEVKDADTGAWHTIPLSVTDAE